MKDSTKKFIIDKWKIILEEYELVKKNQSKHFKYVSELCDAHKISRKQILKYRQKLMKNSGNWNAMLPEKRGPKEGRYRILSREKERILIKIQRKFSAKPIDLWCLVQGRWELEPSVRTISRILKRYPLNKKKEIIHRYEKKIPGELVHGDTYDIPQQVFKDGLKRFLQGYIDDCSRLSFVDIIKRKRSLEVCKSTLRAGKWFDLHGIQMEQIMTDNGPEYTNSPRPGLGVNHKFEFLLKISGLKHIYIRPYRPQTNGKIERFWRILYDEFLVGLGGLTVDEFQDKLKKFMYYYNYQRPHGSLNFLTPLQKLESVTEMLA